MIEKKKNRGKMSGGFVDEEKESIRKEYWWFCEKVKEERSG